MKKNILLFILFFGLGGSLFAQNDKQKQFEKMTSELNLKGCEDCILIDVAYNDWQGDRNLFQSPASSIGINIAFTNHWNLTKNGALSFGVGLGYSYFKNRSFVKYQRDFNNKSTILTAVDSLNEPNKVQFGANYIEIPIDFRFITKGKNHFKFMIGAKIGVNIRSYNKIFRRINGKQYTTKTTNFPDLNLWRYGVTARIGIRNITLFGAYYFSPVFTNDKSTQLYPFSLGLTLSIF